MRWLPCSIVLLVLGLGDCKALGSPEQIRSALAKFAEIRKSTNSAPTIADFRRVMTEWDSGLDIQELGQAWDTFEEMQHPIISREALIDVLKIKQRSIEGLSCRYELALSPDTGPPEDQYQEIEIIQHGRWLLRKARRGESPRDLGDLTVSSYDGEVVRTYYPNQGVGTIYRLRKLEDLIDGYYPLAFCMLLDSKKILGKEDPEVDLAAKLAKYPYVVQESLSTPDGREGLLVVGDLAGTMWLDPKRGFALIRHDKATYKYNDDKSCYEHSSEDVSLVFSDWHDLGAGIFMPFHGQMVGTEGGKVDFTQDVRIRSATLNPSEPEGSFVKVFPRGTTVTDSVRHVVYQLGRQPTIAGAIDGAVSRGKRRPYRTLLIVANLLAIGALVFMSVLWERSRKPGHEKH